MDFPNSKLMSGGRWATCVALAMLLSVLVATSRAFAQDGVQRATRTELASQLSATQAQLAGTSLKGAARERATAEVARINARLTDGDFRVGDRFVYTIVSDTTRADTASVRDGLLVAIANLPDFSVKGVLRSELTERLSAHLHLYLRNASVRTNVLTRVAILGAVRSPGYYYASPDRPLSELVMLAGGPAPEANLGEMEIRRGSAVILNASASKRALKDGRTVEQVDVQSGDEVKIPEKRKFNFQLIVQSLFIVSSLFFALIQFLNWYYSRQQ